MKVMIYLVAAALLSSFTSGPKEDDMNGIWMGYYRSELIKEKVIVKFDESDKMEFYTGGVDERTRLEGSYQITGDSVRFSYRTPEGEVIRMRGRVSRRMNYVQGTWTGNDHASGSFFLERQKVEERSL